MRILIVEDDETLGNLLKDFLQVLQHEKVRVCYSGREAREVVAFESYDCAFVDLMLPDAHGFDLLKTIRNHQPNTPVIVMSGHPTADHAVQAMRRGASDFLAKPFKLQDLALTVERVAKERRLLLQNLSLQVEQETRKRLEQLNTELQLKIQEQDRLFDLSRVIDGVRSIEGLYSCIVSLASRMTAVSNVEFFVLSDSSEQLLLMAGGGSSPVGHIIKVLPIHHDFIGQFCNPEIDHLVLRVADLQDTPFLQSLGDDSNLLSCWPFRVRRQLFGFLIASHNGVAPQLSESDVRVLDFLVKKAALAIENMALYESLVSSFYGILKSLVNALEARDPYTGKHSERVTGYATGTARQLLCSPAQIDSLQTAGYLHDLGKIGIADSILNKPGALSIDEYEVVKSHPVIGESIVSELGLNEEQRQIIRHHHERWDGRGYPNGLAGREIPLLARIVAVADAFDSMTSKRAYRGAMTEPSAIGELVSHAGRQFDPEIVKAFIATRDGRCEDWDRFDEQSTKH
jgi:response regulator RpfG family c-di-GMP phosphodiesterase